MRAAVSAAFAIAVCLGSGAALACEGMAMSDDAMAYVKPNASQKPLVLASAPRDPAAADKTPAAAKKTAAKTEIAVSAPKIAKQPVNCTGNDC